MSLAWLGIASAARGEEAGPERARAEMGRVHHRVRAFLNRQSRGGQRVNSGVPDARTVSKPSRNPRCVGQSVEAGS